MKKNIISAANRLNAKTQKIAFAIGAHPDDIEFRMAGTLLLLKEAGYEIHYMSVANGNCGSIEYGPAKAADVRKGEARKAAKILGAQFHPSLANDMEIFYEPKTLRRLAAVIREVKPSIILTHPAQDYMEDHTNTCRLTLSAAFAHAMPNFASIPKRETFNHDVTIYHSVPHGICDWMRRTLVPEAFVNTASVHSTKMAALAEHKSQQTWLDASQGMNSYLQAMEDISLTVGRLSRRFKLAEGWWRHLHYGFSAQEIDPLKDALGENYFVK